MRILPLLLLLCALMPASSSAQTGSSPRLRFGLNDGWRFHAGDAPGAQAPDFDDGAWTPVELPHTWNAQDALMKSAPYRRGLGWYRRTLVVPAAAQGKRLFLFFEGANQVADVWVNGREAGHHVGGYTAFAMDVSALVNAGGPAVVAVRVDNSHNPDVPPLSADFNFYGGIYRDVWLVATEPVRFAVTDHAGPGVFVDARQLEAGEHAVARVRGTVTNDGDAARRLRVTSRILDAAGNVAATLSSEVRIVAHGSAAFAQASVPLRQPHLWSPDDPYLYTVRTEIREGERVLDRIDTPFGFRWYSYDAQKGFFLNGRPLQLHGTNRHQDMRGLGNALPDALHRRDIRLIKETGFNFLRLAHYPQDPALLDEADRVGLILWEEIPVVNTITQSEGFSANAESMLTDMIRQHYNHPSVFFWGYMNEVLLVPPKPMPANYMSDVVTLARRLDARAHAEDSTRATVMAVISHNPSPELDSVPDILGLNLYFGWYYGKLP
ncbi:MAG TPA: glycoside hydrolase family 2 TIM barrel-domain containing protein, partial [Longimicrobiales bacterium]